MRRLVSLLFFCLIFFSPSFSLAGTFPIDSLLFKVETKANFSGGSNTPFWLVSNNHGLGSPEFYNGYVRGQVLIPLDNQKKLAWGGVLDLVGAWNMPGVFRIQQLFAELKYRRLSISIGSREYRSSINNPQLSSGDLLFSGNSLPIPQFRIGTYEFAPFWGSKDWLAVKAYLAYGTFTDSGWQRHWVAPDTQYTSGVLFCSRALWFKIGNAEKFPLTLELGAEMATQFGGTIHKNGDKIKMPSRFIDWIKAFIPFPGNNETPDSERTNVQGNMNGEYSLAIRYSPQSEWDLKLYYEHYFEDQSQMFMQYGFWKDGLLGFDISVPENPVINKFLYEYISTKDQTGAVNHNYSEQIPEQVSGQDGYFDHYLYGPWQTWGMSISTPLAISPLFNKNHKLIMYDTRFIAHHIGVEGKPASWIDWRMLMTFSQNWGTYFRPLSERMNDFSGLLEIKFHHEKLKGFYFSGAIAWDKGKLLGNNFGGMISIGYNGCLIFIN